jgi:hypothetical protein
MKVASFKLIDGTELIAEQVSEWEENDEFYIIKRPLAVVPMRSPTGGVQIGFTLWSMIINQEQVIKLPIKSLLCLPLELTAEAASSYIQQVTGIALPQTGNGQLLNG